MGMGGVQVGFRCIMVTEDKPAATMSCATSWARKGVSRHVLRKLQAVWGS